MEKLKGKQQFKLEYGVHRFNYVAPFPVLVSVDDVPVSIIGSGKGKAVWKGEGTISLDPTDKDAYGFAITSKLTSKGEQQDDLPAPDPAPADNYLAMMREKVRQQMGITRENFTQMPSLYEMGNIDVFEEDQRTAPESAPEAAQQVAVEQGTQDPPTAAPEAPESP